MKELEIPARPHLTPAAAKLFESELKRSRCYLEYGAGGSTRFAASLNVPWVFSVESDPQFADRVRRLVESEATGTKLQIIACDIGPTRSFGFPANRDRVQNWPNYPVAVWDAADAARASPDLVLIDGRFRVACFLVSLLRARAGISILFDDYRGREERYSSVERYVKPAKFAGRLAVFLVPESPPHREVAADLARFNFDPR
jgi:hypothetical protein